MMVRAHRETLLRIGTELGIKEGDYDGWYKINSKTLKEHGGSAPLRYFDSSISFMLASLFPEHSWDPSRFHSKPKGFWSSQKYKRSLLEDFGSKLGVGASLEGWYGVRKEDLFQLGAGSLLQLYSNSLPKMLADIYPEHTWDPTRFVAKVRMSIGSELEQKALLLKLGQKIGVGPDLTKWYEVTTEQVTSNGGSGLINRFNNSVSLMVTSLFPDHAWELARFKAGKQIETLDEQRKFLSAIGAEFGIKEGNYEAWYNVSSPEITQRGGAGLLWKFGNSLSRTLSSVFPEHKWEVVKFKTKPKRSWASLEFQRDFILDLARSKGFTGANFEVLSRLTKTDLVQNGGSRLLALHGDSIRSLIADLFPELQLPREIL